MELGDGDGERRRCCVAIVGGGLAGLSAARSLAKTCDVLVLEASSALGGRIKHIVGLVPWPVEIGPEFLHGSENSSVKDIADEIGCKVKELPYPDCYYIGSEQRFLRGDQADEHADIGAVHEIFSRLADENAPEPDICMADFLKAKGVSDTVVQLAESVYANDFGCSLKELGVGECIQEAREWAFGDTYIVLDRPLSCIIDHLGKGLNVLLNHAVEDITCSHNGVEIKCGGGTVVVATYVVVTVPVKVLQQKVISFRPPLPVEKLEAASAIGMSNALKVLLSFSNRFWPENMFDVVCTGCFIPEFWSTEYPSTTESTAAAAGKHLLIGFVAGERAISASNLPHNEILSRALSQLDKIFGESTSSSASHGTNSGCLRQTAPSGFYRRSGDTDYSPVTHPASFSFEAGYVVDWSREKFIGGGYSHPSVNATGARNALAAPVIDRIFFAGEATHPGVNPCMQAAIDTGVRAATEVTQAMTRSRI